MNVQKFPIESSSVHQSFIIQNVNVEIWSQIVAITKKMAGPNIE